MRMTILDWNKMENFSPFSKTDNWGDPFRIDMSLIYELQRLRTFIGKPIHVHCGFEERQTGGFHPKGLAVDCHAEDMHIVDFFLAAERFDFKGLGIYPYWNNPGLHLDKRSSDFGARWIGVYKIDQDTNEKKQVYRELTSSYLKAIL